MKSKVNCHFKIELDIIGENFNNDSREIVAISFGNANNNKYQLIDDGRTYIKPEMVSKIPDVINAPIPGPLEPVDEVKIFNFLF